MANQNQPSWGATIGVFLLCWFCAAFCAGISSMFVANGNGFSGYSTGGLLTLIAAAACAAGYRSSGKMGGPIGGAVAAGVVIGFIAAYIGMSMVR